MYCLKCPTQQDKRNAKQPEEKSPALLRTRFWQNAVHRTLNISHRVSADALEPSRSTDAMISPFIKKHFAALSNRETVTILRTSALLHGPDLSNLRAILAQTVRGAPSMTVSSSWVGRRTPPEYGELERHEQHQRQSLRDERGHAHEAMEDMDSAAHLLPARRDQVQAAGPHQPLLH